MEINRLKLLVVGVGSIGKRHAEVLYAALGCRDILLYDPVYSNAAAFAEKFPGMKCVESYESGLKQKPDAVFITSPAAFHMKQTLQALENGCHVMVEKPLDISFENVNAVKEKRNGKIVSVAFCMRKHTGLMRVKELAESGIIGKITSIRSVQADFIPDARPDYLSTEYIRHTGAFEYVHAVDLALWIAGGQPKKISGVCGSYSGLGFEAPDHADVIFETDTGVACSVTMGVTHLPNEIFFNVYGREGAIMIEHAHTGYTLKIFTKHDRKWRTESRDDLYRNQMFEREDREFLEDIISGVQRGCSVEDAERSLKVYWDVYGAKERRQ